jgi:hypothetical protein
MLPLLAMAAVAFALVPLGDSAAWKALAYRGIEANRVSFDQDGLTIHLDRSAGPLVWPLPAPAPLERVTVRGHVEGQLRTTPERQGLAGADDFTLRVGLVEAGTRRPSFLERRLAPAWVRYLFSLAPENQGVGRIRFFNLGLSTSQVGWSRTHPLSDLLHETVVAAPEADGSFTVVARSPDTPVLALWLSADGDDTGSRFTVRIDAIELP